MYEAGRQEKKKRLALRIVVFLICVVLIAGIGEYIKRTQIQPISAELAVAQLEDSDAAFQDLQTLKQTKDYINIGEVIAVFLAGAVFLYGPIRDSLRKEGQG